LVEQSKQKKAPSKGKLAEKRSPQPNSRATQNISGQKLTGVHSYIQEPKSTPSAKGSKRKSIEKGQRKDSSTRTSPSPEGGVLSPKEKERIERTKIAKEEKRFTTYLKRRHSPIGASTGVQTNKFDYLDKL